MAKNKYIPLTFDTLFKGVFSKHPDILGIFLNDVLDLNLDKIKVDIKNNELENNNIKEKKDNVDIFVILNDKYYIDIELNSEYFKDIKRRNISYLYRITNLVLDKGSKLNELDDKKIYQLNLNCKTTKDEPLEGVGILWEMKHNKIISSNPKMIIKNIDKYTKLYYNGNKEKRVVWLAIFRATSFDELEGMLKYVLDKEKIKIFMKEVKLMTANDFVIHAWRKEEWDEYVENKKTERTFNEGRDEGTTNVIRNMLLNGIDLELISKVSGRTIEQIKKIQKQMVS